MARIIYSGLVTKIQGSVGGTTFQSNAYGFTVKNKANIVRPNTADQQLHKLILSVVTKGWAGLTDAQRAQWDTYASTFPQYSKNNPSAQLSGFAVFVKWNAAHLLGAGLDAGVLDSPLIESTAMDTATLKLVNASGVLTLTVTWATGGELWLVNYFMSRPFTASQNFVGSQKRFIVSGSSTTGPIVVTNQYLAKYGALPAVGSFVNVGLQLYVESGGKVLPLSLQRITVTAT